MSIQISIITVCFNSAKMLERTFRSIKNQTFKNIEYIVVDGASTDETQTIVKKYSSTISTFISERDNGIYDAMNKGLRAANGNFIWFLNAGDEFANENIVEKVAEIAQKNNSEIIYGETNLIDSTGKIIGARRLKAPEILTWKSFKSGMLVCHQSFVAAKKIAENYDLQYRFSADFDWAIKCLKTAKTITNSHLILSNYLYEGTTTTNRKASLKERYKIMCKYYGTLPTMLRHIWFAIRFYSAKIFGKNV